MRVDTVLPLRDWTKAAPAAREAEGLGYDGVTSAEIAHDPFVPLALAALATERVRLGTGIVVAFPRSPMVVAQTSFDLHRHSRGRFQLGLGSQVKGHNERRFSVPWSAPVPRMREYVESLRAIWRCWERQEPLAYEGEHYRFTLMTPEFSPAPTGLAAIPISIAAVGPAMLKLAGRVCDGVRLHGFATRKYLEEVAVPQLEEGLAASGRPRRHFEVWGGGFVVTGPDEAAVAEGLEAARARIAFYGSTRTYAPVLAVHGWEEMGQKLHALSKQGKWQEMASEVSDEVVRTFCAVGTHREIVRAIAERFGGITDTLTVHFGEGTRPDRVRELIGELARIPTAFESHPDDW